MNKYLKRIIFAVALIAAVFFIGQAKSVGAAPAPACTTGGSGYLTAYPSMLTGSAVKVSFLDMSDIQAIIPASGANEEPICSQTITFHNNNAIGQAPYGNGGTFYGVGMGAGCQFSSNGDTGGQSVLGVPTSGSVGGSNDKASYPGLALWIYRNPSIHNNNCGNSDGNGGQSPNIHITVQDPNPDGVRNSDIFLTWDSGNSSIDFTDNSLKQDGNSDNSPAPSFSQCPDQNFYMEGNCTSGQCNNVIIVTANGTYLWPLSGNNPTSGNGQIVSPAANLPYSTVATDLDLANCYFVNRSEYNSNESFTSDTSIYFTNQLTLLGLAYQQFKYEDKSTGFIKIAVSGLQYDKNASTNVIVQGGGTGTADVNGGNTCEDSGGPLSWITCQIITGIADTERDIENGIVEPLLETKTIDFTPNTNCSSGAACSQAKLSATVIKVWSTLRIYGNLILIIGLLVVIYAESIGGGLAEAYTAQKIVPRLLATAILINLSLYIVAGLEDIFNVVGVGLASFIEAPFHSNLLPQIHISFGASAVFTIGMAVVLKHVIFDEGAPGLLMAIFGTGLIAVIGVLAMLVFRQGLIILLLFTSPIAFALYLLPNTEKYFRQWWSLLVKTLIIFPLISLIFGLSDVAASVMGDFNLQPTWIADLVAMIALIIPLFLIPFAFKLSGGILGSVQNTVNGLRQRLSAPISEARKKNTESRKAKRAAGGYQDRGIGRFYNRVGAGAKVGWRGKYGFGRVGRAAVGQLGQAGTERTLKENERLNVLKSNDNANAVMALSGGTRAGAREAAAELFDLSTDQGKKDAEDALAAADAVGYTKENAAAALQTMSQSKSRAVKAGDYATVENGINRLYGSNKEAAKSAIQTFQYNSRESGRGDLGGAWHTEAQQLKAASLATATGMTQEEAMKHVVTLDGIGRTEVPAMVRGYPEQLKQYAATLQTMMNHPDDDMRTKAARHILEMQKALPYASDDNQEIINGLVRQYVDVDDPTRSVESQLADQIHANTTDSRGNVVPVNGTVLNRTARVYDSQTGEQGTANPRTPTTP